MAMHVKEGELSLLHLDPEFWLRLSNTTSTHDAPAVQELQKQIIIVNLILSQQLGYDEPLNAAVF